MSIFWEVRRNPVHNHTDAGLVEFINHIAEIVRRAKAGSRSEQTGDLIAPRGVKRVFAQRQKLHMRKAHIADIRNQSFGKFAIGQKFTAVIAFAAPRT